MRFRMIWMGSEEDPKGRAIVPPPPADATPISKGPRYELHEKQMVRRERRSNGEEKLTPLANFHARVVRETILDDGVKQRREFEIEAELGERKIAFPLAVSEFGGMNWVLHKMGAEAIIYPGRRQHARAAIQSLSGPVVQQRVYAHLGWRRHQDRWLYLCANGALGSGGLARDVQVQLPQALEHYQFYLSETSSLCHASVRASLGCLSVAPDRISIPLLAAVYRSVFGEAEVSLFLSGTTGVFKTALAALCQQHFGSSMDAAHLPANFASTANAIERLAFDAKDALMVIDDFVPTISGSAVLEKLAERLFRSVGNHQGRHRLGTDGTLDASRPPRAMILATGEEVPRGESLRARLLVIDVGPGDVDRERLSGCQQAAQGGSLAEAMGRFIAWLADRHEEHRQSLRARVERIRFQGRGAKIHPRLPFALAELEAGWQVWLEFALEIGAIDPNEHERLVRRGSLAMDQLAAAQEKYHHDQDPAHRFFSLIRLAVSSGSAHVANRKGAAPEAPQAWGWRQNPRTRKWVPQGTRIGWIIKSDLFVDPETSYDVAQRLAGNNRLPIAAQTLHRRLRERGLLLSTDQGRQMVQVRRILEGGPKQVLHFHAETIRVR